MVASGRETTVRNANYNGTIAPNGTTSFGSTGTSTGANPVPAAVCTTA